MTDDRTDFEKQRDAILLNYGMMPSVTADMLTAQDFVMNALKYDPSQDGLILCQHCGITWDFECDYGGWHDESQYITVSVPWLDAKASDDGNSTEAGNDA